MTPAIPPENPEVRELIDRAMKLSPADRESIALELLDSVEAGRPGSDHEEFCPSSGDLPDRSADEREAVRRAWQDELARRIRDVQEGKVALVDAREAVAQTRQRIREKFGL